MSNYANQIKINLNGLESPLLHTQYEEKRFLLSLNWEPLLDIMSDLSAEAFRIWLYFNNWHGQGYYEFSPADLEVRFGISENTIRKYRKELEEKCYLIKISQNKYEFNPYPSGVKERASLTREKNSQIRKNRKK